MTDYSLSIGFCRIVIRTLLRLHGIFGSADGYKLLAEQEIRSVRVGRAYKIPKICVIEYLLGEEMCHISFS